MTDGTVNETPGISVISLLRNITVTSLLVVLRIGNTHQNQLKYFSIDTPSNVQPYGFTILFLEKPRIARLGKMYTKCLLMSIAYSFK